jgi:hypothetical protein
VLSKIVTNVSGVLISWQYKVITIPYGVVNSSDITMYHVQIFPASLWTNVLSCSPSITQRMYPIYNLTGQLNDSPIFHKMAVLIRILKE